MNTRSLARLYRLLIAAVLIGLASVSQASADFIEYLEGSGDSPPTLTRGGNVLGLVLATDTVVFTAESAGISNGFSGFGSLWRVANFDTTVNILESSQGPISDLLEVKGIALDQTVTATFKSDVEGIALTPFTNPTMTFIESGEPQSFVIVGYATDPNGMSHDLTVTFQSDSEAVPEPETAFLLLAGCVGLFGYRWRSKKLQD